MRPWIRALAPLALGALLALVPACPKPPTGAVAPPRPATGTPAADTAEGREGPDAILAADHGATYARYAVAADHPLASAAGAEVLSEGGNAADAAVATMLALGVVSPASSGLGGGGFALYFDAESGKVSFVDFRETAPSAARPDMFQVGAEGPGGDEAGEPEPAAGLSAGVPGEPRGMEVLLERFGSKSRADVAAPAIRLAEEGFTPGEYVAYLMSRFADDLREEELGRAWLGEEGSALDGSATLANPALARTLRVFADEGADPFYEGAIAADVVAAVKEAGGIMKPEDLRAYAVDVRDPIAAEVFGHRWVTTPPESAGGYSLLMALGLLERWRPAADAAPWTEVGWYHAVAEAFRGPFIDRARYFGDPRYVDVPVAALLADDRVDRRAGVFDPATEVDPAKYDFPLPATDGPAAAGGPGRGTSHLCVVDAAGNVASVTTTVNWPFGIRESVHGFWINNELDDFTKKPGEGEAAWEGSGPNVAKPGHRPVSSMAPTLVFDAEGRPVLCIGGSGGTRIITSIAQVGYRIVVGGQDPRAAVTAPRIHASDEPGLSVEEAFPEALAEALRARGHAIEPMRYGANVQAIAIERPMPAAEADVRLLQAASDPRKGGRPAGR